MKISKPAQRSQPYETFGSHRVAPWQTYHNRTPQGVRHSFCSLLNETRVPALQVLSQPGPNRVGDLKPDADLEQHPPSNVAGKASGYRARHYNVLTAKSSFTRCCLTKSISRPSLPEWDDGSSARHGTIGNIGAETRAFTERDRRLHGLSGGKVRYIPSASITARWIAEGRRCRRRLPHGCRPRLQLSERAPPRAGRAIHAQSHSQKNG